MSNSYDAIVIGARCAGSPTAMLLARRGYKVLLVDRASFPSDTVSTHVVQPKGVAALARWGLLDLVVASGCPPVNVHTFDFGPVTISGRDANAARIVADFASERGFAGLVRQGLLARHVPAADRDGAALTGEV